MSLPASGIYRSSAHTLPPPPPNQRTTRVVKQLWEEGQRVERQPKEAVGSTPPSRSKIFKKIFVTDHLYMSGALVGLVGELFAPACFISGPLPTSIISTSPSGDNFCSLPPTQWLFHFHSTHNHQTEIHDIAVLPHLTTPPAVVMTRIYNREQHPTLCDPDFLSNSVATALSSQKSNTPHNGLLDPSSDQRATARLLGARFSPRLSPASTCCLTISFRVRQSSLKRLAA